MINVWCRARPASEGKISQLARSCDALSIQERAQQSMQDTAKRMKVIEVSTSLIQNDVMK